jgi:rfaE bifunctional protein nucleotidyltransferase chain/domain
MKVIGLASDHNGVDLKEKMRRHLKQNGYITIDVGPYNTERKVDYVDYANQISQMITNSDLDAGILICGTGVGMSIAANRYEKVRAALVHNKRTAPKCREHNNSNVLCLGNWTTSQEENFEILNLWLDTNFGEGRHVKRVEKLSTEKRKVVFTNGVFDILHTGHVELLRFSKSLGEKLVVAINSDASVKRLKGQDRPINNQEDRKKVLEALSFVDEVIVFEEDDPKKLIDSMMPNLLVKGGEWTAEEVRRRDNVSGEVEIKIYPFLQEYSTTSVIQKIHSKKSWRKVEQ